MYFESIDYNKNNNNICYHLISSNFKQINNTGLVSYVCFFLFEIWFLLTFIIIIFIIKKYAILLVLKINMLKLHVLYA